MLPPLQQAVRWLLTRLKAIGTLIWRLLRPLWRLLLLPLTWLIWKPLFFVTKPLHPIFREMWEDAALARQETLNFLKRLRLAARDLLRWFVWEPIRFVFIRPLHFVWQVLVWLVRRVIWPPVRLLGKIGWAVWSWLAKQLYRLRLWLTAVFLALFNRFWQATAPRRARQRRRFGSWWTPRRARLRLFLRRPAPPKGAIIAPPAPRASGGTFRARPIRIATAVSGVLVAVFVLALAINDRQNAVSATNQNGAGFLPEIIREVVTATPVPTTPTPVPTPTLPPWPTPDPLTDGGTVAFALEQNGNSDLYLLAVGQERPLRLTYHPAADRSPAWSPDGREIAFASQRDGNWEIYVYNLPLGELRRMTDNPAFDGAPSWSPDGQWLVYETYSGDNLDVAILRADGSEGPFRITRDDAHDFAPVWSPSGRHVAFVSWRAGNQDIFLMSLDEASDENAVNLTNTPNEQENDPAFAPEGRYLAYAETASGFPIIYALPLSEQMVVTGERSSLGQQGAQPAWSPTSQSLLYVLSQSGTDYLMAGSPTAWGVAPQLFAANGRLSAPSWTPVTLNDAWTADLRPVDLAGTDSPLYTLALAEPSADGQPARQLFEMSVNAPSPYLSDHVDESFVALRQRLINEAGWDVLGQLDNMFEAINERPLPGQSNQSWNKAGRAFDLYYREVLAFEPRLEVVREQMGSELYWRVYVKTALQDGTQGEPLRELPWDFRARFGEEPLYYDQGGKLKESVPSGYFVDLTALAADYGWARVPADDNWRTFFPGIRFWHFQHRGDLTWDEAMGQLYSEAQMIETFGER